MDSFNATPPFLGQRQPDYPPLLQLLRVTSATVPGPSGGTSAGVGTGTVPPSVLYVASTQQLRTDTLSPRDREPCLVVDVNGYGLASGYYLGRLAGSYQSLPVYEVTILPNASGSAGTSGTVLNQLIQNFGPYLTWHFVGPNVFLDFTGAQVTFGIQNVTWGTDQTDFVPDPTTMFLVVDLTANVTLKSLGGVANGRPLWIIYKNNGAFTLTIGNENAAGTAAMRMRLPGNADYLANSPYNSIGLVYDTADSRWYSLDDKAAGSSVPGLVSPLTTKGDVWVYGTQDTRLPVGASSKSLVSDSSVPLGLNWAGGFSGSMVLPTSVTCVGNVLTVVTKVFYWVEGRLQSIT